MSRAWRTILQEAASDGAAARDALAAIVEEATPTVAAVMYRMSGPAHVEDLIQSFFAEKIIAKRTLARLDLSLPDADLRRSMLGFIAHVARAHAIDWVRSESKRRGREKNSALTSGVAADRHLREWASRIMQESLRRTELHFKSNGRPHYWEAFCIRVLNPSLHSVKPESAKGSFRRLGFKSSTEMYSSVLYVKRCLTHAIRQIITEESNAFEGESADSLFALFKHLLSS